MPSSPKLLRTRDFPCFLRLAPPVRIDLEALRDDFLTLSRLARENGAYVDYSDSSMIDLTYIDPGKPVENERWAGTSTLRAVERTGAPRRLVVGRHSNPMHSDKNHNAVKPWAEGSLTIRLARELGEAAKVTYACLKPTGWWPAHYDFSPATATKINIVLTTNPDCFALSWNPRTRTLEKRHMGEGECWFVNTGRKHTAHNWGVTDRVHLLITFKNQGILAHARD